MNNLNGGYMMIDVNLPRPQLLSQLEKALKVHKPLLVYNNDEVEYMTIKKTLTEYTLTGTQNVYRIRNDGYCFKFPINVEGSFTDEFKGFKRVNAELHDSYIMITLSVWYSDENDDSLSYTSGDEIASLDISQELWSLINSAGGLQLEGVFYEDGDVATDPFYLDFDSFQNAGKIVIKTQDDFTLTPDSGILAKAMLLLY